MTLTRTLQKRPRTKRRARHSRLIAYGIILGALVLGGFSPAMSASAAGHGLSATGPRVAVHGTHVTARVTVKSTWKRTANRAGVCVRSASGRNVDFPAKRHVTLTRHGAALTVARTFAPGRYTYAACVQVGGRWTAFGWKHTFTVPKTKAASTVKTVTKAKAKAAKKAAPAAKKATAAAKKATAAAKAPAATPARAAATTKAAAPVSAAPQQAAPQQTAAKAAAASGSPTAMPVGNLPGWRQVFTEDFTTPLAAGSFPGPYAKQWMSYDGFTDTSGVGTYDQSIISAHDGTLDLHLQTRNGKPLGAAPIPLVGGAWGGQQYGMFSIRAKADALPGFGAAFLLWPDSNNWSDGEIDFPEGALDGTVSAFNHCPGNPQSNCLAAGTKADFSQWHVYTIEWTPNKLSYLIDGKTIGSTTKDIPQARMHWVGQVGTTGVKPASSVNGHLLIDWMTIYAYQP